MASPFFDLAQLWQQGQQQQQNNAYRNALLQLNQQNQQLKARQVLQGLAAQKLIGSLSGGLAQPGGGAAGAGPESLVSPVAPLNMTPMPSGGGLPSSFPQVPNATAQMAAPGLADLQKQVLNLEGNRDVIGAAGEIGPGQIMPATGAQYGYSPSQLMGDSGRQASGRIVADLYQRSGGDPAATLVGYNRGPGAMARFQAAGDNPSALKSPLAPAYQKAVLADLSPEQQQQGSQVAVGAAGMLPPQMVGRGGPDIFARLVDRVAGSNAPDEVKGAALMQLLPLMSQEGQRSFQQAFEMYRLGVEQSEKSREFGIRQQEVEAGRAQTKELAEERMDIARQAAEGAHGADWQILQTPDGKTLRVNRRTGETQPIGLPAGTTKLGGQGAQQFSEGDVDYWANVLKAGGHLPPGLARTAAGSQLVQKIMAKIPGLSGGDPGAFIENASSVKADDRSLSNMTKMADAATSFERTANMNFDTALRLSKDAVPTDWGPWLNKFIETGETQAGNTDVPPYVTAMLTAANEYAKIMSGSTGAQGSTVDSRREAAELFSPYLSAGQIDRVVAIAKNDMANRKQSLYGQIDDIKARLHSAGSGQPTATQGQPAAAQPAKKQSLDVTEEQYNKLPSGAAYTVPGNPTVMYKP